MSPDERAFCVCGGEVALVRLTPSILRLGHRSNPKNAHHYVRLARSAADRSFQSAGERQPRTEGAGHAGVRTFANAGPSHPLTTRRQAGQSEGSARSRISPSGISATQMSGQGASQSDRTPTESRTPRSALTAGRSDAAGA